MKEPILQAAGETYHRGVHRLAVLFSLVVFPLIWLGGLVTTFDAGMAVPDWPNTYGYNLFLYPIYDWFFGPWDLFVEHGHRLLASLAGLIAIAMVIFAIRFDRRTWYRKLAVAVLLLVIFQGVLGGLRVVLDDRLLAMVHGCTGPTFFLLVVALSVCSSKWWFQVGNRLSDAREFEIDPSLFWLSSVMLLLSWCQLLVGANLRHFAPNADPMLIRSLVMAHLTLAGAILIGSCWTAAVCFRGERTGNGFRKLGVLLMVCVSVQIALGLGTWVVKFGWPAWMDGYRFAAKFVINEKSFLQMNIVTAHVAIGSLVLGVYTIMALRSFRMCGFRRAHAPGDSVLGVTS